MICRVCRQDKNEADFYEGNLKNHVYLCKPCEKEKSHTYYENNKAIVLMRMADYLPKYNSTEDGKRQ